MYLPYIYLFVWKKSTAIVALDKYYGFIMLISGMFLAGIFFLPKHNAYFSNFLEN